MIMGWVKLHLFTTLLTCWTVSQIKTVSSNELKSMDTLLRDDRSEVCLISLSNQRRKTEARECQGQTVSHENHEWTLISGTEANPFMWIRQKPQIILLLFEA